VHKPDITNIRATEGPPLRNMDNISQHSLNCGLEAPEGFRSNDCTTSQRKVHSRLSNTSDYESNTPTPEITSSVMDYHPSPPKPPRLNLDRTASYSSHGSQGRRWDKPIMEGYYNSATVGLKTLDQFLGKCN